MYEVNIETTETFFREPILFLAHSYYDTSYCFIFGGYFDHTRSLCPPSPPSHPRRLSHREEVLVSLCRHTLTRSLDRDFYCGSKSFDTLYRYPIIVLEIPLMRYPDHTWTRLYIPSCMGMDRRKGEILPSECVSRYSTGYRLTTPSCDSDRSGTGSSILYLLTDICISPRDRISSITPGRCLIYIRLCSWSRTHADTYRSRWA